MHVCGSTILSFLHPEVMMISSSGLGIWKRLFHAGGAWSFDSSINHYICPICFLNLKDFIIVSKPHHQVN
jgi:hypothetical protein